MIFTTPLPFIKEFIDQLDQGIRECAPTRKLSKAQRWWLSFCLMGILLSNSVCWAAFERVGLGIAFQKNIFCFVYNSLSRLHCRIVNYHPNGATHYRLNGAT